MDIRKLKKVCIVGMLLLILSNKALAQRDISMIKFVYGWEGILIPLLPVECNPESFHDNFGCELNFLTTYDEFFFDQFSSLYVDLKPDTTQHLIDPRIVVIVYRTNEIPNDTLYLGETNGILLNGTFMEDDFEFLNFVKAKIGWKRFKGSSQFFPPQINRLRTLYNEELLFKAIDNVATEVINDESGGMIFGDTFFPNANSQLYRIKNAPNGAELINKIDVWCQSYVFISNYMYTDESLRLEEIFNDIPQICEIVHSLRSEFEDDWQNSRDFQIKVFLPKFANYMCSLSSNERTGLIKTLIGKR